MEAGYILGYCHALLINFILYLFHHRLFPINWTVPNVTAGLVNPEHESGKNRNFKIQITK